MARTVEKTFGEALALESKGATHDGFIDFLIDRGIPGNLYIEKQIASMVIQCHQNDDDVLSKSVSVKYKFNTEVPVTKGEGQYQTLCGFLDLVSHIEFDCGNGKNCGCNRPIILRVEVKTDKKGSISEVVRQINYYRSIIDLKTNYYNPLSIMAVAVPFEYSESEEKRFKENGILVLEFPDIEHDAGNPFSDSFQMKQYYRKVQP